jgi:hypothetical protein
MLYDPVWKITVNNKTGKDVEVSCRGLFLKSYYPSICLEELKKPAKELQSEGRIKETRWILECRW